jgi:hypothetical protein
VTNRIDEIKAKWSKLRAMRPLVGTLSTEETDALVAEIDRLRSVAGSALREGFELARGHAEVSETDGWVRCEPHIFWDLAEEALEKALAEVKP